MPLRTKESASKPAASRNPSLASTRSLSSRVLAWGRRSTTTALKKTSTASSTTTTDENVMRSSSLIGEEYSYYHHHHKKASNISLQHASTTSHAFERTRKTSSNTPVVAFTKEEQRKIRMVASPGEHFDENGELVAPAQTPQHRIFSLLRRNSSFGTSQQQQPLMELMYGLNNDEEEDGFAFENPSSTNELLLFGMCFFTESQPRDESEECC